MNVLDAKCGALVTLAGLKCILNYGPDRGISKKKKTFE